MKTNSENVFEGANPLKKIVKQKSEVYGGEFVAQVINAAWETVPNQEFTPNSIHTYFLRADNMESVILYEVKKTIESKSFIARTVECYQTATDTLCVVLMILFARKTTVRRCQVF